MRNKKIRLGVFSGLCGEKVIANGNERTNERRSVSPTTTDGKLQMPDERFGEIGGASGAQPNNKGFFRKVVEWFF